LWECELNVGEYNTIDMVEENTTTKNNQCFFKPASLKCKRKVSFIAITLVAFLIVSTRWQQCMCKVSDG
jgi:hypothetical protein